MEYNSILFIFVQTLKLNIMPNWCENYITITGDKRSISVIKDALESIKDGNESSVFKVLVGIKPEVTFKDYDSGEWYDANVNYWGTKWDVCYTDCNFEFEDTCITMTPSTAWSPPVNFGVALAKMYNVTVTLIYSEGGCGFAGRTIVSPDGEMEVEDYDYDEGTYKFDNESFWYRLEDDITNYFETKESNKEAEEYIKQMYPFLDKEDMMEAINIFNEKKSELWEE